MAKPVNPNDGRLKSNRDFSKFMQRAVHIPSVQRAQGKLPFALDRESPYPAVTRLGVPRRPSTDYYDKFADESLVLTICRWLSAQNLDHEGAYVREVAAHLYWRCVERPEGD